MEISLVIKHLYSDMDYGKHYLRRITCSLSRTEYSINPVASKGCNIHLLSTILHNIKFCFVPVAVECDAKILHTFSIHYLQDLSINSITGKDQSKY